jgi:hypothetical protein
MNKQKVTLSLDPEIYRLTREMLKDIPGTPSVSSLVDDLLRGFTATLQGPLKSLAEGGTPADATKLFHGGVLDFIRILEQEDEKPAKAKK